MLALWRFVLSCPSIINNMFLSEFVKIIGLNLIDFSNCMMLLTDLNLFFLAFCSDSSLRWSISSLILQRLNSELPKKTYHHLRAHPFRNKLLTSQISAHLNTYSYKLLDTIQSSKQNKTLKLQGALLTYLNALCKSSCSSQFDWCIFFILSQDLWS